MIGVTHQTATRCLGRAAELGVIGALDDRQRAGRDPTITAEAKADGAGVPEGQGDSSTLRIICAEARIWWKASSKRPVGRRSEPI
jgi:hypothetical protein